MRVSDRTLTVCGMIGLALIVLFGATGCTATAPPPVTSPCGVIVDGLADVAGRTPADTQRIDRHHARGRAAGCW